MDFIKINDFQHISLISIAFNRIQISQIFFKISTLKIVILNFSKYFFIRTSENENSCSLKKKILTKRPLEAENSICDIESEKFSKIPASTSYLLSNSSGKLLKILAGFLPPWTVAGPPSHHLRPLHSKAILEVEAAGGQVRSQVDPDGLAALGQSRGSLGVSKDAPASS